MLKLKYTKLPINERFYLQLRLKKIFVIIHYTLIVQINQIGQRKINFFLSNETLFFYSSYETLKDFRIFQEGNPAGNRLNCSIGAIQPTKL